MIQTISNVRYVHHFDRAAPMERGRTIAYLREDLILWFAWADKRPCEPYVKAVGREITTERLENFLRAEKPYTMRNTSSMPAGVYLTSGNEGFLTINYIRALMDHDGALARSTLEKLTFLDFTHSFLSSILAGILDSANH